MYLFRGLRRKRWVYLERKKIRQQIAEVKTRDKLRLNIGSGPVVYDGWINLDLPYFDLTELYSWQKILGDYRFDLALIEHVLEHLTESQVTAGLKLAHRFIEERGNIRIAVPDRNHPNPEYIEHMKPGGTGPGADDHKSFWNISTLGAVAKEAGFEVIPVEYHTEQGELVTAVLDESLGPIIRTVRKPREGELKDYSSLIVDLKPQQ